LGFAAAGRGGGGRLLEGSGGGFVGGFAAGVCWSFGALDFGASTFVSESGAGGTWGTYRGGGGGSAGPLGTGAGLPSNASCAATTNMGGGGTLPGVPLGGGCGWSSGTSWAAFHSFQPRVHTGAFAGMTPRASATRSSSSRTSRCWPAGSAQRHWVWLLTWKDPERCPQGYAIGGAMARTRQSTCGQPAARSTRAHSSWVAPVVRTSSTSRIGR
jgi:hypothetical protein